MEDKLHIVEPLIDKREEQEKLIERAEKELELRRDVLDMLKKEEQLIRAKDESGFNELRSELPEDEMFDQFFAREERFPKKPKKQIEKIVEKEVEVGKDISVDLDEEVPWKDCIKGAATWFLVFGGIILLAGIQTMLFEIIEGGIRSVFVWLMIICGLFIGGVGAYIAWSNRKVILYERAVANAEPIVETEQLTEIVDNDDYDIQYEEYKHSVVDILKANLAKQEELKGPDGVRKKSDEIKEAKAMIFRIDKLLYPGILNARYVLTNGVNRPIYYSSADLRKIVKVVKTGKVSDLKKACEFYEKYVTMANEKVRER